MAQRRRAAAAAAAAALAFGLATAPAGAEPAGARPTTADPRELASAVRGEALMDHLEVLESIADANGGNRAAGTRGHEASVRYLERRLSAAGYSTWRQEVPLTVEETVSSSLEYRIDRTTRVVPHLVMTASPGTGPDGVTGRLVTPSGRTTGCLPRDWRGVDASGGIALVTRGSCSFDAKSRTAAAVGASALIVHNSTAGALNGTLRVSQRHVPTVGVAMEAGRALASVPPGTEVTVVVDKVIEERETVNLFAEARGGRAPGVVLVGAHLDSDPAGPGINDNGSGSVAVLETALRLADAAPPDRTVRFVWWGAGELGDGASRQDVAEAVDSDPALLDDIRLYLDVDRIASPNGVVGVYDLDESASRMPAEVSAEARAAEHLITERLDAIGQPWVPVSAPRPGDHRAFADEGVPVVGVSAGGDGTKTREEAAVFGGTAGLAYDPNQHTVADRVSNVDPDTLAVLAQTVAYTTAALAASSTEEPGAETGAETGSGE